MNIFDWELLWLFLNWLEWHERCVKLKIKKNVCKLHNKNKMYLRFPDKLLIFCCCCFSRCLSFFFVFLFLLCVFLFGLIVNFKTSPTDSQTEQQHMEWKSAWKRARSWPTAQAWSNSSADISMTGQKVREVTSFKKQGAPLCNPDGTSKAEVGIRIASAMAD